MKTLVLETSSEYGLIAVVQERQVVDFIYLLGGAALSKSLGADIKKILDKCPPPYERIVVGVGPGSFTGIRVGAAMAQALSFGWDVPLYIASSLNAFASAAEDTTVAIAVDARSGGVYVQMGFGEPQLLSLAEAEIRLQSARAIASPHPSRIIARLPNLSACEWLETRPDPLLLVSQAALAPSPLVPQYLSSPS